MLGAVTVFDRSKHTKIRGEIGRFVERLAEKSGRDLFVVRYEMLDVFCICEWMSPQKDVFIDTMNLGKSLANFDYKKSRELQRRLFAPLTANETSRKIAEAESDYHHMRQDENEEEGERLAKIARGE